MSLPGLLPSCLDGTFSTAIKLLIKHNLEFSSLTQSEEIIKKIIISKYHSALANHAKIMINGVHVLFFVIANLQNSVGVMLQKSKHATRQ